MTSQSPPAPRSGPTDSANKTALGKARAEVKDAQARVKAEEKARKKAENALSACREDVKVLQGELDQERQLRIEMEKELAEAREAASVEVIPSETLQENTSDIQAEDAVPDNVEATPSEDEDLPLPNLSVGILIEGFQLLPSDDASSARDLGHHPTNPSRIALRIAVGQEMLLKTRFHLTGSDADQLAANEQKCKVEIYSTEIPIGTVNLLCSSQAKLAKDTHEYIVTSHSHALPAGYYRLFVVVTSDNIIDYQKGPFILVQ
jgi:hypothetical protein